MSESLCELKKNGSSGGSTEITTDSYFSVLVDSNYWGSHAEYSLKGAKSVQITNWNGGSSCILYSAGTSKGNMTRDRIYYADTDFDNTVDTSKVYVNGQNCGNNSGHIKITYSLGM